MNAYRQGNAYNEKNRGVAGIKSATPQKLVILYQRLSREDGDKAESDSIQNQRKSLSEYAKRNNLTPFISVQDDGTYPQKPRPYGS